MNTPRFQGRWAATRPFGINHREDPETEYPDGITVHLDGDTEDLAPHEGVRDDKCVGRVEGGDVVLSYSEGPVKEVGTFGSGRWRAKGGTLLYSYKELPGRRALSSGRVELLYTLRCLAAIRFEGWAGMINHRLDNQGVVKKYRRMKHGFRVATAADADMWAGMRQYNKKWDHKTKIIWVKGHAEKGGKLTDRHEMENDRVD